MTGKKGSQRKIAKVPEESMRVPDAEDLAASPRPAIVIELPTSDFIDAHKLPLWMANEECQIRRELLGGIEQDGEIRPFERTDVEERRLTAEEFQQLGDHSQRRHAHFAALRALVESGSLPARNGRGEITTRWMEDVLLIPRSDVVRFLRDRGFEVLGEPADAEPSDSRRSQEGDERPLRKRALIATLTKEGWTPDKLESYLSNAGKNGLARAKAGHRGWYLSRVREWGRENGEPKCANRSVPNLGTVWPSTTHKLTK